MPATAAWCGAFVSTSPWWPLLRVGSSTGRAPIGVFVGVGLLLGVLAFLGWRLRRLAAVAASFGLLAGLAMGTVQVAGLHSSVVDDLARQGASAQLVLVVTADPVRHPGTTAGSSRRGSDTVIVAAR
ncbi:MAG: hypothetical protein ACXV3C_08680, partial [Actinomycetes bacterium]